MKPNGLVFAASMTSQMSIPMQVKISFQLVDHRNVDGAKNVFGNLDGLGDVGTRDGNGLCHDLVVESDGELQRFLAVTADDLWNRID